ncbi:MAG: phage shock protein PspA [Gammaproteobacteria bacterium]|nr:phage shock protein PspA [Gammaproteobacteria bacterium]
MSIFSRFADIINSNMSALLDKAEDPQKLIRMIIQEMEDTLVEVRTESARLLAKKKELQRKLDWFQSEVDDWQNKAELAVAKNREDLAKAALSEKHKLEYKKRDLENDLLSHDQIIGKLSLEINQLQDKLVDARARQQSLVTRLSAQTSRVKVNRSLYDSGSTNVVEKFEQIERKLDALEADAETFTSADSQSLKSQFDDLESEDKIDQELHSLKEKLKSSSKNKEKQS